VIFRKPNFSHVVPYWFCRSSRPWV